MAEFSPELERISQIANKPEQYRALNSLLNIFTVVDQKFEEFYTSLNGYHIVDRYLILNLIKKFKLLTHAIEILKNPPNLVLQTSIINLNLLYEEPSPLTQWSYFDSEIIPHVSHLVRCKLLHRLAKFCRNPRNAEEFFDEYSKKFNLVDVRCFIPYGSPEFIVSTIELYTLKLTPLELDALSKKVLHFPQLFDLFYVQIKDQFLVESNNKIKFPWFGLKRSISQENLNEFYDILEKYLNFYPREDILGYNFVKRLIQHDRILFITKALRIAEFTQAKLVRDLLSEDQFVDFMVNYCHDDSLSDLFNRWNPFCSGLMKTLTLKEKEKLVACICQKKLKKTLYDIEDVISLNSNSVNVNLLAVLPQEIREAYVERTLRPDDRAAEKIQLLPIEKSVPRLREMMVMSSQMAVRCSLVRPLIQTCIINNNFIELFRVLSWLFDRYRNDSESIREQIFQILSERYAELTVSDELHQLLVDQLRIAVVKDEAHHIPIRSIVPQLISWRFDHGLDAHDLMRLYIERTSYYDFSKEKYRKKMENLFFDCLREQVEGGTFKPATYNWTEIFEIVKSKDQRASLQTDLLAWLQQKAVNILENIDTYDEYDQDDFLRLFYRHNSPWTRGQKQDFLKIFSKVPLKLPTMKKRHKSSLFSTKFDFSNRIQIAAKLMENYRDQIELRPQIINLSYQIFKKKDLSTPLTLLNFALQPPDNNLESNLHLIFDQVFFEAISKSQLDLTEFTNSVHDFLFSNTSLEKYVLKMPQTEILAWINSKYDQNPTFQNQLLRLYFKLGSWTEFFSKLSKLLSKDPSFNQGLAKTLFHITKRNHRREAFVLIISILDSVETLTSNHFAFLVDQLLKTPSKFQSDLNEKLWILIEKFSHINEINSNKIDLFEKSIECNQIKFQTVEKIFDQILFNNQLETDQEFNQDFSDSIFASFTSILQQLGVEPLNLLLKLFKTRILVNFNAPFHKNNKQLVQNTRELFQLFLQFYDFKQLTEKIKEEIEKILSENLSEIELGLKPMKMFDLIIDYRVVIWDFRFDNDPDETLQEVFCYLNELTEELGLDLVLLVAIEPLKRLFKTRFTDLNRTKTFDFFMKIFMGETKLKIWQIFVAGFLECFSDNPREYCELSRKIQKGSACVRVSKTMSDLEPIEDLIGKLVRDKKWDVLQRLWPEIEGTEDQQTRRKIVKIFAKNDLDSKMCDEEFWLDLQRFVETTEFEMHPDDGNVEIDQMLCFYKIIDFYVKNERDVPRSNIDFLIREFLKFSLCVWNLYKENFELERLFLCRFLDQILDLHPISSEFWVDDSSIVFSLIDAIADFHERNPTLRIPDESYDWLVELFIHHGFKASETRYLISHLNLFFDETLIPKERFEEVRKFLLIHDPTKKAIEYFNRENPKFLSENSQAILGYLLRKDHYPNNNDCKAITDFLIDLSQQKCSDLIEQLRNECVEIFKDPNRKEDWKTVAELYGNVFTDQEDQKELENYFR